jgi:hypothetical protein
MQKFISKEDVSLYYVKLDEAIKIIKKLGPGSWLCKLDVEAAFKQIPIHPSQWHLFLDLVPVVKFLIPSLELWYGLPSTVTLCKTSYIY